MSFQSEVKEIIKDAGFLESEEEQIFEVMAEILEKAAERIETNEPHAKLSINKLMEVSREIRDMENFIKNHSYEDA